MNLYIQLIPDSVLTSHRDAFVNQDCSLFLDVIGKLYSAAKIPNILYIDVSSIPAIFASPVLHIDLNKSYKIYPSSNSWIIVQSMFRLIMGGSHTPRDVEFMNVWYLQVKRTQDTFITIQKMYDMILKYCTREYTENWFVKFVPISVISGYVQVVAIERGYKIVVNAMENMTLVRWIANALLNDNEIYIVGEESEVDTTSLLNIVCNIERNIMPFAFVTQEDFSDGAWVYLKLNLSVINVLRSKHFL